MGLRPANRNGRTPALYGGLQPSPDFRPASGRWFFNRANGPANRGSAPSRSRFVVLLIASVLVCSAQPKSLYERLGRYDGIAATADEYLKGIRSDPRFARFAGRGADSLQRARQLLKDQWCALSGGPCVYIGRDMKIAHTGLAITAAEWAVSMKYLAAALDKQSLPPQERKEFLTLVDSLKKQIVERP